jgi:cytochrome bd ubiquinol oxidase subunit II
MHLNNVWFVIVAIFWVGFFVLEGFDFGVGMLHSFVAKNDAERRLAVNSIGPFWDGNEVWLIVAAAAMFAAFPSWYATLFSSFYLVMLLVLVALMFRGVSFEYHRKIDNPKWKSMWRWGLTIGSALIPLLLGTALGDLLHGLPINQDHTYTGTFWQLFQPFALYTGITLTLVCLLLGATFLALKTEGDLRVRCQHLGARLGWVVAAVVIGFVIWSHATLGDGFVPDPLDALAIVAVIGAAVAAEAKKDGQAFAAAAVGIAGVVGSIFLDLAPRVMVSSTNAAYNLTISNSASPSYSLQVMTVVAVIFFPMVLIYQGWNFHVFRARLSTGPPATDAPAAESEPVVTTSD